MGAATVSVDEFQALEQKVLRAVELIRKEREARATAEAELTAAHAEVAELKDKLAVAGHAQAELDKSLAEVDELKQKLSAAGSAQAEVDTLNREREAVRVRVEKMLSQIDELL
jgi:chromosome segregation ATPase